MTFAALTDKVWNLYYY